ncbi:hypothetical protein AGLY_010737 [Aphis glycines]|uniref:Uncharacterized protein n=1 Tax=Aphis glycines TaxID=307491 RepID=A0A6G0TFB0_APHGL|nr:hypothetical protein AGLY_010737 [Aphis glycines]
MMKEIGTTEKINMLVCRPERSKRVQSMRVLSMRVPIIGGVFDDAGGTISFQNAVSSLDVSVSVARLGLAVYVVCVWVVYAVLEVVRSWSILMFSLSISVLRCVCWGGVLGNYVIVNLLKVINELGLIIMNLEPVEYPAINTIYMTRIMHIISRFKNLIVYQNTIMNKSIQSLFRQGVRLYEWQCQMKKNLLYFIVLFNCD